MDTNDESWSKGLKFVTHTMNTSVCRGTGKSPYEVVFGQQPLSDIAVLESLADQGILDEENISDDIILTENDSASSVGFYADAEVNENSDVRSDTEMNENIEVADSDSQD